MHKTLAKQKMIFGHEIILKNSMTKLNKQNTSLIRFIFGILNEENIKSIKLSHKVDVIMVENPFLLFLAKMTPFLFKIINRQS